MQKGRSRRWDICNDTKGLIYCLRDKLRLIGPKYIEDLIDGSGSRIVQLLLYLGRELKSDQMMLITEIIPSAGQLQNN